MSRKPTGQDDGLSIESFKARFPDEVKILHELWRLDAPDPLKILAGLVSLMADSERAEKHVKQYQDAKAAADRAKAALAEARAKHDQHIADTTAELDQSRASLRRREIEIVQREGRLAAGEARLRERDETEARRTGRLETFHSGLVREREIVVDNPDPHYGSA
jgi:septal ring factor EnvC (AmiA/AmiB activator)